MTGTSSDSPRDTDLARRNRRTAATVAGVVFAMIGLAFASVPLYDLFCRVTGFGGTTQVATEAPAAILDRVVTIRFDSGVSRDMPWQFSPQERQVAVNLGERKLISYRATNPTKTPVTGTAIYNVTPTKAGKYFHKIQCFCFAEQVLNPGETMSMPVVFFVDPKMNDDPDMADVESITLSYTFFKAASPELDMAMEGFYNR